MLSVILWSVLAASFVAFLVFLPDIVAYSAIAKGEENRDD